MGEPNSTRNDLSGQAITRTKRSCAAQPRTEDRTDRENRRLGHLHNEQPHRRLEACDGHPNRDRIDRRMHQGKKKLVPSENDTQQRGRNGRDEREA
jgi:hypothetical protein